ncbi:MAG: hypothetical protein M3P85_04895 [Actinomycetota bacterium]|nr:hypothetical protein [Actinomycetota bacterium]
MPLNCTFKLAGYRPSALPGGRAGPLHRRGFTDAAFTAIEVLEDGRNTAWPF